MKRREFITLLGCLAARGAELGDVELGEASSARSPEG